jgi:hypothetical protein
VPWNESAASPRAMDGGSHAARYKTNPDPIGLVIIVTLRFTLRLIFDGRLGGNPLRREWLMNVRFAWRIRRIPF